MVSRMKAAGRAAALAGVVLVGVGLSGCQQLHDQQEQSKQHAEYEVCVDSVTRIMEQQYDHGRAHDYAVEQCEDQK